MTMYKQPTTTRGEILRVTGLNAASLSHTLGHLISAGVVIRVGELDSKAGRPRDLLRLNPEAAYFVAIDLEASPVRFAITNFLGDIRYRWEEEVDRREATDVASIAKGVEMVCRPLSKAEREVLLAIGISPSRRCGRGRSRRYCLGELGLATVPALKETGGGSESADL